MTTGPQLQYVHLFSPACSALVSDLSISYSSICKLQVLLQESDSDWSINPVYEFEPWACQPVSGGTQTDWYLVKLNMWPSLLFVHCAEKGGRGGESEMIQEINNLQIWSTDMNLLQGCFYTDHSISVRCILYNRHRERYRAVGEGIQFIFTLDIEWMQHSEYWIDLNEPREDKTNHRRMISKTRNAGLVNKVISLSPGLLFAANSLQKCRWRSSLRFWSLQNDG